MSRQLVQLDGDSKKYFNIIHHFTGNSLDSQNNIALLKISENINFEETSSAPICLPLNPSMRNLANESVLEVVSMKNSQNIIEAEILKEHANLIDQLNCKAAYKIVTEINENHICAISDHLQTW